MIKIRMDIVSCLIWDRVPKPGRDKIRKDTVLENYPGLIVPLRPKGCATVVQTRKAGVAVTFKA